jgi:hypothetical protein
MTPAQVKSTISPELLNQIDIRVGTIESVSDVAHSEKLGSWTAEVTAFGVVVRIAAEDGLGGKPCWSLPLGRTVTTDERELCFGAPDMLPLTIKHRKEGRL